MVKEAFTIINWVEFDGKTCGFPRLTQNVEPVEKG